MEGELQLALRQIVNVLEELLDRPSRWNGRALLAQSLSFSGMAHYDGSISINEAVYADPNLRWRTLLHETLHTFSPQYTRFEYSMAPGWEEGVVEAMQRLIRPQVFASLGITVDNKTLLETEAKHPYNAYVAVLEDIRQCLSDTPLIFYQTLLACPLTERSIMLRQSGVILEDSLREEYRTALLKAVLALSR